MFLLNKYKFVTNVFFFCFYIFLCTFPPHFKVLFVIFICVLLVDCILPKIKASVRYFLSNFYFLTKWWEKLWEMFFISSKNLFSFSRYSDFFPSFPHFPDSKGQMELEQFIMSWIDFHKFADVNFGAAEKLLYITSLNLVR